MVLHNKVVTSDSSFHKEGVDVSFYLECLGFKSAEPSGGSSPHVYDQVSACREEVVFDKSSSSHQSSKGDPSFEFKEMVEEVPHNNVVDWPSISLPRKKKKANMLVVVSFGKSAG